MLVDVPADTSRANKVFDNLKECAAATRAVKATAKQVRAPQARAQHAPSMPGFGIAGTQCIGAREKNAPHDYGFGFFTPFSFRSKKSAVAL